MRAPAKTLGWGLVAVSLLISGGIFGGAGGFFGAGLLLVYAIPIWGFTRNQRRLTKKGSELATSVDEVEGLIDRDAAAFRWVFAVFFPWRGDAEPPGRPGGLVRAPRARAGVPSAPLVTSLTSAPPENSSAGSVPGSRPAADESTEREPGAAQVTFWQVLTAAERTALKAIATDRRFLTGAMLCREGTPGEWVYLIRSGWTKVCVQTPKGERIIARRGPGDIVGERAVMPTGTRSASVIAEEIVHAYVVAAGDFLAFVRSHPRLLDVLDRQLYGRLTEEPASPAPSARTAGRPAHPSPTAVPAPPPPAASSAPSWTGQNCSIVLLDVTAFGARNRTDADRLTIRRVMYQILQTAFESAGMSWAECHRDDRGDGVLVIVPPGTPTDTVVDAVLAHLVPGLARHNGQADEATRFQLRVALDVGPVISDPEGVSGQAIIHAARLLDCPVLKRHLARDAAHVGLIVSSHVHDNVIIHHTGRAVPGGFQRVTFQGKESRINAWMYLAGLPAGIPPAVPLMRYPSWASIRPPTWLRRMSGRSRRTRPPVPR
ncbi:MAG TPA: cyclic nucleotide-binding domain-containing protein [Streptosporangiaceae bacterium]